MPSALQGQSVESEVTHNVGAAVGGNAAADPLTERIRLEMTSEDPPKQIDVIRAQMAALLIERQRQVVDDLLIIKIDSDYADLQAQCLLIEIEERKVPR